MIDSYQAPLWLRSSFVQTVASGVGPRKWFLEKQYQHSVIKDQWLDIPCEQGVTLKACASIVPQAKAQVIAIHGWEGAYDSAYMLSLRRALLGQGVSLICLHLRDHGPSHHLNEGVFNSSLVHEVAQAVKWLQGQYQHAFSYLMGFSLGGNFSLRIAALGEQYNLRLQRVLTFSPVIKPALAMEALKQPSSKVYEQYFARKWRQSLLIKQRCFPDYDFARPLKKLRSLDAMNHYFIPKYTPFDNLDDYFDSYDVSGNRLASTCAPCHILTSEDDPIVPPEQFDDLIALDNITLEMTPHGGHCAFMTGFNGDSWQNIRALQLIHSDLARV